MGTDGLVWGVEPICAVLSEHGICIAPSTYYEHIGRRPSARMLTDARVIDALYTLRCAQPLMRVLGSRKTWIVLLSNGIDASRCTVERVMREMGWRGALKKKNPRTTIADPSAQRVPDLVKRQFRAVAPNRLWVADFTYCRTKSGWVFTAFVVDVFARKIVGWKTSSQMSKNLVTDAVNFAIESRKRSGTIMFSALIHHSDAGSQYTALTFGQRLTEEGIMASIGTVGQSYDNALAESINADYKNELVDNGPLYPGMAELVLATAEWVAFYNRVRPNTYCCDLTPDRAEELHYARVASLKPEVAVSM